MSVYIRPPKYHNTPTEIDGIRFDSKAEAGRYLTLKALKASGNILWFSRQPSFLLPGGVRYMPDFLVCDAAGLIWVEDVKGVETEAFKIKKKLWEDAFPGLELRVIR